MKVRIALAAIAALAVTAMFVVGALAEPVQAPQFFGSTPVTASAVGTTGATTATIAAVADKTAFLCGFSIRSSATAAVTGDATVTGIKTGTLHFTHFTAPLASGVGVTEPPLGAACVPASAVNQAIAVVSPAPGSGGTVSVTAWGFYQ